VSLNDHTFKWGLNYKFDSALAGVLRWRGLGSLPDRSASLPHSGGTRGPSPVPVQGWFAHGVSRDCKDIFEGVICLACGGVHLVNPKTGKLLGAVEKANPQQT